MTVICEGCGKIGEMPDPWPEDADIWEKLSYHMPYSLCSDCLRKLMNKNKEARDEC